MAPQLAGSHILDHTPTQRADGGISAHGELLLSEVANTSSSSGRGSPPRYNRALNSLPTPTMAPPRSGYRGSDLVLWHDAFRPIAKAFFLFRLVQRRLVHDDALRLHARSEFIAMQDVPHHRERL